MLTKCLGCEKLDLFLRWRQRVFADPWIKIWYHCRFKREMHGTPL